MPITITRHEDLYMAEVSPPHGGGRYWESPHPMAIGELVKALEDRGCYQTDIGDAFHEADPEWQSRDR